MPNSVIADMARRLTAARDHNLTLDPDGRFVLDGVQVDWDDEAGYQDLLDSGFLAAGKAPRGFVRDRPRPVTLHKTGQDWLNNAAKEN